jgi:hypothetical protein
MQAFHFISFYVYEYWLTTTGISCDLSENYWEVLCIISGIVNNGSDESDAVESHPCHTGSSTYFS